MSSGVSIGFGSSLFAESESSFSVDLRLKRDFRDLNRFDSISQHSLPHTALFKAIKNVVKNSRRELYVGK